MGIDGTLEQENPQTRMNTMFLPLCAIKTLEQKGE